MRKITLFLALTFSMLSVAQDRFQKIDSLLTYLNKNDKFMGALCIREGENVVYNKGYGFADIQNNIAQFVVHKKSHSLFHFRYNTEAQKLF